MRRVELLFELLQIGLDQDPQLRQQLLQLSRRNGVLILLRPGRWFQQPSGLIRHTVRSLRQ